MKICAVWILLWGAAFSLYAQSTTGISMFVSPVDGMGRAPGDNDFFTGLLTRELRAQRIELKETPGTANYSLSSTITPYGDKYLFSITLRDKDGRTLYEQGFQYSNLVEGNRYVPSLLFSMLTNVFALEEEREVPEASNEPVDGVELPIEPFAEVLIAAEPDGEAWRNKKWYFGANVFWSPRLYYGEKLSAYLLNFSFGFLAEYHFFNYYSIRTGMELTPEWVVASSRSGDDYGNTILQIPLAFCGVFKPRERYMLEPHIGILFNIPFFPATVPSLFSWETGFQFGLRAGQGVAYANFRYAMDFTKSGLAADRPGDTRQYSRYMLYMGVGYKYGFFPMRTKENARARNSSRNSSRADIETAESTEPAEAAENTEPVTEE